MDVFLSYSWDYESEEVKAVFERLSAKGYSCWLDNQQILREETLWAEEVRVALRSCKLVLLFYSDKFYERLWGAIHLEHKWIKEIQAERNGLPFVIPIGLFTDISPPGQFAGSDPIHWKSESDLQKVVNAASKAIDEGKIEQSHIIPAGYYYHFKKQHILSNLWARVRSTVVAGENRWKGPLNEVRLSGINLGLLGKKKTDYAKVYVGSPNEKQIQDDVEKEYPFAFASETFRVGLVCNKLVDLLDVKNPKVNKSNTLNLLSRISGNANGRTRDSFQDVISTLAKEILVSLRNNQPREIILSPENSNNILSDCVLGVKIITRVKISNNELTYELEQIYKQLESIRLNCNSKKNEAAVVLVLSVTGEDVQDLHVRCFTRYEGSTLDIIAIANHSFETSSTKTSHSKAIDVYAQSKTQEEVEFKRLLSGRCNESMNLLDAEHYREIIDLWSPLDSNIYFKVDHKAWSDKPQYCCQIHTAKEHLFIAHVQLGTQSDFETHMPSAFRILEEVLTVNPYATGDGGPDQLPPDVAETLNFNYKGTLEFASKWLKSWGGMLKIYGVSSSECVRLETRVHERLHEVGLLSGNSEKKR